MSAALQLNAVWSGCLAALGSANRPEALGEEGKPRAGAEPGKAVVSLAFYRKHTENMLRRYLYASMLVGRAPSLLDHPVARGWATSRPVHTFEDAVNFVLDIERCLGRLCARDRYLIGKVVVQEYTIGEVADMLGVSVNSVAERLGEGLDRLTKNLLRDDLLILPR